MVIVFDSLLPKNLFSLSHMKVLPTVVVFVTVEVGHSPFRVCSCVEDKGGIVGRA